MEKKTELIGLRVRPEFKNRLEELAKIEARSLSNLVYNILDLYIEDYTEKLKKEHEDIVTRLSKVAQKDAQKKD